MPLHPLLRSGAQSSSSAYQQSKGQTPIRVYHEYQQQPSFLGPTLFELTIHDQRGEVAIDREAEPPFSSQIGEPIVRPYPQLSHLLRQLN